MAEKTPAVESHSLHVSRVTSQFRQDRRKDLAMAKKAPWHSVKSDVYHDDTDCNTGNNIERENLRSGTGGKPKCSECKRLNG